MKIISRKTGVRSQESGVRRERGFTLIELILTISVLGFLAVAALPTDQDTVPVALEAASRKVKSDIRYAQNLATTTGDPHGFRATGATTYEIYNVTTGAIVSSPLTNQPMQENLSTNYEATAFGAQNYQIEFDRFGQPTMGGGTIIQLDYDNDQRQIQVTNTSGYVGFL